MINKTERPTLKLPKSLTTKTFGVLAVAVVIYAAVTLFVGWDELSKEFNKMSANILVGVTLLSFLNYGLRFWRWEIYLRSAGASIPWRESLKLYFATYLMVITPGKIGEALKASIIHEHYGHSLSRGLPVVIAERITDFLAVLVLCAIGIFFWPGSFAGLNTGLMAAATLPILLTLFQWKPVRTRVLAKVAGSPLLKKYQVRLDESSETLSVLLGLKIGGPALAISIVAWLAECMGLWLVCYGLDFQIPVGQSIFIYTVGTIVGSLSMLPGGIGGTEAVLIWLLQSLDMSGATAATAALLIRMFTLWLAVLVGIVFYMASRPMFSSNPDLERQKVNRPE
ncbi:MAG: hypothetical protein ACI9UQ_000358 [Candidatus Krumholzibacteriia bacterium]